MSVGYYHECPSCSTVRDVGLQGDPLVWFDVDRVDPEAAAALMRGERLHALPVLGDGRGIVGIVNPPSLPHRVCDACGQDGCVDCIPDTLCATCQRGGYTEVEVNCPGCMGPCGRCAE